MTPSVLEELPVSLPLALSSFVGRESELQEVQRILAGARLVTLTGPPGCGKTRLGLECARRYAVSFDDGVRFVDLSQVTDENKVLESAARACGLLVQSGQPVEKILLGYLSARQVLVILDNCEHVVTAAARLSMALLSACPRVRILATSQVPLGIPGEQEWLVPSLAFPERQAHGWEPVHLEGYAAIRLFVERAGAVQPGFRLTQQNSPLVAEICHRLDGIPLAIELAAVRVKHLSLEQIIARLGDRFNLLADPKRLVTTRHQTLQSAIDWAFSLLNPDQGTVLRRLAILNGTWTLGAAEAVCGFGAIPRPSVIHLLGDLVDRSLVVVTGVSATEARYRLLESIRLYGLARIPEEELAQLKDRSLDWFCRFACEADRGIHGPQQVAIMDRLEADLPNIRAALEWAIGAPTKSRLTSGLTLASALSWFSRMRGYHKECAGWLESILELVVNTPEPELAAARAYAHYGLAWLYYIQKPELAYQNARISRSLWLSVGETGRQDLAYANCHLARILTDREESFDESAQLLTESQAIFHAIQDEIGTNLVILHQGWLAETIGERGTAERLYRQAYHNYIRLDSPFYIGLAAIVFFGELLFESRRCHEAQVIYQTGLQNWEKIGFVTGLGVGYLSLCEAALIEENYALAEDALSRVKPYVERAGLLWLLHRFWYRSGTTFALQHRFAEAERCFLKGIDINRLIAAERMSIQGKISDCLTGLAVVTAPRNPRYAARLAGFAHQSGPGEETLEPFQQLVEQHLKAARKTIGESEYQTAFMQGRQAATIDDALLLAQPDTTYPLEERRKYTPLKAEKLRYAGLTIREREVAVLVAKGYTNLAIANQLFLSERTVTTHITHILAKLGYSSRTQIAAWTVEKGLLSEFA